MGNAPDVVLELSPSQSLGTDGQISRAAGNSVALQAQAQLRRDLPLGQAPLDQLFLRFERVSRLADRTPQRHAGQVGVFACWRAETVRRGDVQAMWAVAPPVAQGLKAACKQLGLRFVDNV